MTDKELFHQLVVAALSGLAATREDYPENIARDAVRMALVSLKEIKKQGDFE